MAGLGARLRAVPTWQVTLAGALLVLGFLVVTQLRAEPVRVEYTTQERPPLLETVNALQQTQDQLSARILSLRSQIQQIESSSSGDSTLLASLDAQLIQARVEAGLVGLAGPGIVLQISDSTQPVPPGAAASDYLVSASDLRAVVDELWLDGAEAIAVNGERIVVTSAFTDVGPSVLLNGAYLQPPYQISAIGPADLYSRLTQSVSFANYVHGRVQQYGLGLGVARLDKVQIPAYAGVVNLNYAQPVPTPTPSPAPSPTRTRAPTPAGSRAP